MKAKLVKGFLVITLTKKENEARKEFGRDTKYIELQSFLNNDMYMYDRDEKINSKSGACEIQWEPGIADSEEPMDEDLSFIAAHIGRPAMFFDGKMWKATLDNTDSRLTARGKDPFGAWFAAIKQWRKMGMPVKGVQLIEIVKKEIARLEKEYSK